MKKLLILVSVFYCTYLPAQIKLDTKNVGKITVILPTLKNLISLGALPLKELSQVMLNNYYLNPSRQNDTSFWAYTNEKDVLLTMDYRIKKNKSDGQLQMTFQVNGSQFTSELRKEIKSKYPSAKVTISNDMLEEYVIKYNGKEITFLIKDWSKTDKSDTWGTVAIYF